MNTEVLKSELNNLSNYISSLSNTEECNFIKNKLVTVKYQILNHISELENEKEIAKQLKVIEVDGVEVKLPYNYYINTDDYMVKYKNNVLYTLTKGKDAEEFHVWSYAVIPNGEGYIHLNVRLLGGDSYGDRVYVSASYYKKYESFQPYYSKDYGKNESYPRKFDEYVRVIIDEFNELNTVNRSFVPF